MEKKNNIVVINFAEAERPSYKLSKGDGKGWVDFGVNNTYPDYLLKLFKSSSKHGSIIKSKTTYITGKGWAIDGGQTDAVAQGFIERANPYEALNTVTRKASLDIEMFGGAYLQIVWNNAGTAIAAIYHIKYNTVRTNEDNTSFWVRKAWNAGAKKNSTDVVYPAFNPNIPAGTQILFLKEYNPDCEAYPLPGYMGSLNYIAADISVSEHVLGNAETGFTGSKMISLFDGEPTEEEEKALERSFQRKFTGTGGKKIMLAFPKSPDHKPQIDDLGVSDLTKEDFTHVDEIIQQNIYSGHQLTSPALFGIATPGKLGSTNELRDAYEIFKNTYVNDKQMFLEENFNMLLKYAGSSSKIYLQPTDPIGLELKDATLAQSVPKSWLYEKLGIDPNKYNDAPAMKAPGGDTIAAPTQLSATAPQKFSSEDEILQIFSEYGQPKSEYFSLRSRKVRFGSDEDMLADEIENAPVHIAFAEQQLTELEANILNMISKDKRVDAATLADVLKVSEKIVKRVMGGLASKGKIKVDEDRNGTITRELTKPLSELRGKTAHTTKSFYVRYSYEGPKDDRNRAFCAKLLDLDRVYSRADIEAISLRLGYSVFDRRGGWYTIPGTNESRPYCRHWWESHVVIKNGNDE